MVEQVKDLYFEWMTNLVMPNGRKQSEYSELLNALNNLIFYFTIPLDENRAVDGAQLRYRFGETYSIETYIIQNELDNKECSMLEMMVALALRGEENIMDDPDMGNQISSWFMEMIESLKLIEMTNENYDQQWVEFRIDSLLNHEYEPNGDGGLFTVNNPRKDMRYVEIWYQMMWYLNTILN